jgi:DEAD/DEAH box helicase domain-containing protein
MAPLYLMCDPHDLGVVPQVKNPFTGQSTIFLYDSYPGGIGFSQKLYDMHETLLDAAAGLLKACQCEDGCPSCVGPAMEIGPGGKGHTLDLINGLLVAASREKQSRL